MRRRASRVLNAEAATKPERKKADWPRRQNSRTLPSSSVIRRSIKDAS